MNSTYRTIVLLLGLLATGGLRAVGSAPPDPGALDAAREELRVSEAAWRRLREEFARLMNHAGLRPDEAADYRAYLEELEGRVQAQRNRVASLGGEGIEVVETAPGASALPDGFDRGQTTGERISALDAELGSSLSAFDETLLREQQALSAKSQPAGTGDPGASAGQGAGAGAAGGAEGDGKGDRGTAPGNAGRSRTGSGDTGGESGGEQPAASGGEAGTRAGTAGAPADGRPGANEQVGSTGSTGDRGTSTPSSRVPADVGSGEDDDIVARQIREAAEKERDPALREKLWEEYRRYKGRGGAAASR